MLGILGTHVDRLVLFGVLERLFVCQSRVLEQDREDDQRHTDADTDNAQNTLDVHVCGDNGGSGRGADGVRYDPGVR